MNTSPKSSSYRLNLLALFGCLLVVPGLPSCGADSRERGSYSLELPPAAKPFPGDPPPVPGKLLEGHLLTAPAGAGSIVVFRSKHLPDTTPSQLITQRTYLLRGLPSLAIHETRELDVDGHGAVLIDLTAPGDGKSLAPTGLGRPVARDGADLVPTRRLWLTVLRPPEHGTLEVFFHAPAAWKELEPAWTEVLRSLRV